MTKSKTTTIQMLFPAHPLPLPPQPLLLPSNTKPKKIFCHNFRKTKSFPNSITSNPSPFLHFCVVTLSNFCKMDIIPFYYENGQLEALSSAHQWLKQSEMSAPTCSIWSSGLNDAIARERIARDATLAGNGGAVLKNIGHAPLALEMGTPTGILVPSHLWQQQKLEQQQQQRQQIKQNVKNNIVNKINRRRKAAIIARCAGSSATSEGISLSALSASGNDGITVSLPSSTTTPPVNVLPTGTFAINLPKPSNQRTPITKATLVTATRVSPSQRGTTTDASESDEESDVEVFEVDELEFGNDDLFDRLNSFEEKKHNDDDPKVAQWRKTFGKAISERYRNKCRRRNMLCRRMLEFNLQRLKATENIELSQLLLTDLRIREKYAVTTERSSDQLLLTHRETGRVFICLEDMFDVLSKFHTEHGHGGSRKAMYVEARKRFANVSKEIVREFLKGCDQCTGGRESNGWGGRRVKGAGRGVATTVARATARGSGTPTRTTEIVGGLALRQYMERMEQKNKQQHI